MKKIKFNGFIYTVEEEFHDSYKLSGGFWVKKSECEKVHKKIPFEYITIFLASAFFIFHLSRILIIELSKIM